MALRYVNDDRGRWIARLVCLIVASILHGAVTADEGLTLYGAARNDAAKLSAASIENPLKPDAWQAGLEDRRQQWLEMLGLSPLPPRTPLQATVTGTLERGDYVVEKVHFQSLPGAYVIGNLYRPAVVDKPLPAVLYLCGHSKGKVNPSYQANSRWFAQHGYVALVLDPIQLGESQGFHHGTYSGERWDWPSRGYTPAGTEVWNAMRALDYLESRDDVDAERMGVTGLSGGGVISWCLGAADTRVKVVVPVCQSGSISQVVTDRGVEGHCDCAFWINYRRWCWPDIGSLIAPRALMIASGAEDVLWRPAGYRDVAHRIRRQYYQLEANEQFELVEDESPHGYTPKLRLAIFTWFNKHLKGDGTAVAEDITDFVEPEGNLLVFGGALPKDDRMAQVDTLLVQQGELPDLDSPTLATKGQWMQYANAARAKLLSSTFRSCASGANVAAHGSVNYRSDGIDNGNSYGTLEFLSADGVGVAIKTTRPAQLVEPLPTLVFAIAPDATRTFTGGGSSRPRLTGELATAGVEVRNSGATSLGPGYLWTARRTYPLLGQTLPERQVSDLLAAIAVMNSQSEVNSDSRPNSDSEVSRDGESRALASPRSVAVFGKGPTAPLAIYTSLLDPGIEEIVLQDCPTTHTDPHTPEFLGVLRVGDLPHNLALAFPRPITFVGRMPDEFQWTKRVYEKYGLGDRIRQIDSIAKWSPW